MPAGAFRPSARDRDRGRQRPRVGRALEPQSARAAGARPSPSCRLHSTNALLRLLTDFQCRRPPLSCRGRRPLSNRASHPLTGRHAIRPPAVYKGRGCRAREKAVLVPGGGARQHGHAVPFLQACLPLSCFLFVNLSFCSLSLRLSVTSCSLSVSLERIAGETRRGREAAAAPPRSPIRRRHTAIYSDETFANSASKN